MEFDSRGHENAILEAQRILREAQGDFALRLEHAINGVRDVAKDTVRNIGKGGQRLLWRTSYFFEGYEDVNQRINKEDKRMIDAIGAVIDGGIFENNVIRKFAEIYMDKLLEPHAHDEPFLNDLHEKLVRSSSIMLYFGSKIATSGATKNAIMSAITETIYIAVINKAFIREGFRKMGMAITFGFQIYGYVDKAAVSASKLKRECPTLYWSLYASNIEMLYFIFEPLFKKGISVIQKGKGSSVDDVYVSIMDIIGYE
ncbi:hypothetical protein [Xenorhabdus griffiniae]|uniref:Uncharacterized protein n=1 Tax=Xenorhabdus griffiniae TaxID=351672 RepID=A0ABY9XJN0_9GAMM|nr:hypothetical protein [Xenorhabdus griffiniae]MBD1226838.1 hypothetical protein [Xenorhabdus griffiniae]MBE8586201.1 hypothetical protein [Xenorhabdus griffiniae]WMV73045.1 hypothetical protein QL128_03040 [Xenorhabdus griffiniae]WNH02724.1 hypothetical protein QL112_003045 [Xenorhabdus griffiniae]